MAEQLTLSLPAEGPDRCFKNYLAKGQFCLQCCDGCERYVFYPRIICPHCGAGSLSWKEASGKGYVYSTSTPRSKHDAYNISLVDLAEGPRMMSRVVDIEPEDVVIGMAVEAFIGRLDEGGDPVVLFRPAAGADA